MEQNNIRNSVLGSFFWKFGERFLSQGIAFITSLILARLLAPSDYGVIAIVTVFTNLSAVFINSGFATALIQKKDANDRDFSTMFFCSLGCSVLIYLILFLAAPLVANIYKNPDLTPILRVYALQVPLSVYQSIQTAYISRHMLFRKVFISSAINAVVSGVAGIGAALAGFGVWALVLQYLMGTITNSIVLTFLIPWRPKLQFSKTSAKSLMAYGSRILAADLSGTFFTEVRSLIIGGVYTSADLAYYNKGLQIPQLLTNNLSSVMVSVMFPTLANHSDDLNQVKMMTKRSIRVLAYVIVPCMFGLAAVMEPLILILFTEKWAQTIPFGQILSIGLAFGILSDLSLQILKAIGRSDVVLGLEIKKKPMYVLLLIVGTQINVLGLAVAMLAYDLYATFINMMQLRKYISYGLREQFKDLFSAFALSIMMAVVVWLIPSFGSLVLTLAVKLLAGVGFYLLGSVLFRIDAFCYLLNIIKEKIHRP